MILFNTLWEDSHSANRCEIQILTQFIIILSFQNFCNVPELCTPRYCPLWPSAARICPFPIRFPGGHPSDYSPLSTLNFGIPKNPKPIGKGASCVKSSQALYLRDTCPPPPDLRRAPGIWHSPPLTRSTSPSMLHMPRIISTRQEEL